MVLAVNYTARLLGIKRGDGRRLVEEKKRMNPQLIVLKAGELFEKQDYFTPHKKSDDIFQVLLDYQKTLKDCNSITIERSSKDQVYIDVTKLVRLQSKPAGSLADKQVLRPPTARGVDELTSATKTHPNAKCNGQPCVIMEGQKSQIHGSTLKTRILEVYPKGLEAYHADETLLVHGAFIALQLIKLIKERTGFDASAGVAHNKLLAKLACDRNKPQGITIFTDISIPRLSKNLEFKGIPGYCGKRGDDLLAYFSQRGQGVRALHDIVTLRFDKLVDAFGEVGSNDKLSEAIALLNKCHGQDDSKVRNRHVAATMNVFISFRGTHAVRTLEDFEFRVLDSSRGLMSRIKYTTKRWNWSPYSLVVKTTVRASSGITQRRDGSRVKINGHVAGIDIRDFITHHLNENGLEFPDIELIKVTAGNFKLSPAEEVAANITVGKGHAAQAVVKDSSPGASKTEGEVKTVSIEFNGSRRLKTSQELWREMKTFSEEIARQIDFIIITERRCPSKLVVNVTLYDDGAGSKTARKGTKESSLLVGMVELPHTDDIHEFLMRYMKGNKVEARQIQAVQVTLKGSEEFGEDCMLLGRLLPIIGGFIPCPHDFVESEDDLD